MEKFGTDRALRRLRRAVGGLQSTVRRLEMQLADANAELEEVTAERDMLRVQAESDERLPVCPKCCRSRLQIWCERCNERLR
jgi:cell division protein FtsB